MKALTSSTLVAIALIGAVLVLGACGKKSPPSPPGAPGDLTYPKTYPTQ